MAQTTGPAAAGRLLDFERFGEAVAFATVDHASVTYRQFAQDCDAFAERLGGPGRLVLLPMDNGYRAIVALYAIFRSGNVALLCETSNPRQQARLIETFDPDFVLEDGTPTPRRTGSGRAAPHPDLALVINTSGSTGSAKCVRLSLGGIEANAADIAAYLGLRQEDRALLTLPLHYCYGLSVVGAHLSVGATVVPGLTRVTDAIFRETLDQMKISHFPAVPHTIEMLERLRFRDWDLPHLRILTQAGGKLDPALVRRYAEWATRTDRSFFVMYGATEATSRMSYMTTEQALRTPDAIGRPIRSGAFDIVDEDGISIPDAGRAGELVYEGPNVMMGYAWTRPDLAKAPEVERLRTGDIAERTSGGLYRIVGRASRFSKIFGRRQNLADIETALAAAGIPAAVVSDDRHLFVAVTGGEEDGLIADRVQEDHQIPSFLTVVLHLDELPRLASGKVDYQAISRAARHAAAEVSEATGRPADAEGRLQAAFSDVFRHPVGPEDSFQALGGDSLSYVRVSLSIEDVIGTLPDGWERMTLRQLSDAARPERAGRLIEIDTGVLVRFFAIVFVVANHSGIGILAGGALLLLFLSGLNLGRFHFLEPTRTDPRRLASSLTWNVLVPFWIVAGGFGLAKGSVDWESLSLLVAKTSGATTGFPAWFVVALMQCVIATVALALLFRRPDGGGLRLPALAVAMVAVGLAVHLAHVVLGGPESAARPISLQTRWYWFFSLGFLAAFASTAAARLGVVASLFLLSLLSSDDVGRQIIPAVGGAACVLVSRSLIPGWMRMPILWISGASLFIYLLHLRAPVDSMTSDWPVDVIRIGSGLALGVAGWLLFDWASARLARAGRALLGLLKERKANPGNSPAVPRAGSARRREGQDRVAVHPAGQPVRR